MLITVAEIVFQVVALVLECVKGFIFDLPSCPTTFDQLDNVVFGDGDIGYPAVVVGYLFAVEYGVFKVVDVVRIPVKTATYSGNKLPPIPSSKSLVWCNTKVAGLRQLLGYVFLRESPSNSIL